MAQAFCDDVDDDFTLLLFHAFVSSSFNVCVVIPPVILF